jgi:hypothetical protein
MPGVGFFQIAWVALAAARESAANRVREKITATALAKVWTPTHNLTEAHL